MATISNTPRPGFIYDSTDGVWYPIGTGTHSHSEIAKTIVDAKGDLIVGTAADTVARQAVGTDGQMLYADSTQTNGIKWADAPASGSMTLLSTTTLSGSSVTLNSIPSTYKQLYLTIIGAKTNFDGDVMYLRYNGDTGTNYSQSSPSFSLSGSWDQNSATIANQIDTATNYGQINVNIPNYTNTNTYKIATFTAFNQSAISPTTDWYGKYAWHIWKNTSAISSITILTAVDNFNSGTAYLYGVN